MRSQGGDVAAALVKRPDYAPAPDGRERFRAVTRDIEQNGGSLTPALAEEFARAGWIEIINPYDPATGVSGRGRTTELGDRVLRGEV